MDATNEPNLEEVAAKGIRRSRRPGAKARSTDLPAADLQLNRAASPALLAALDSRGPLRGLIKRRSTRPGLFDVQLRGEVRGARTWASLYVGLTAVLNVWERTGSWRLSAHKTHMDAGGFSATWSDWQSLDELVRHWPDVEQYLDRLIPRINPRLVEREGAVHATICSSRSPDYRVANREVSLVFRDKDAKERICDPIAGALYAAVARSENHTPWWPTPKGDAKPKPLGTGLDVLAVGNGRVLAIEAKPADSLAGIVWGPVQVRFYAELFGKWVGNDAQTARHCLQKMIEQRVQLGLSSPAPDLVDPIQVVPVLAIGDGKVSSEARTRMTQVAAAIEHVEKGRCVGDLEVWRLGRDGEVRERWI